MFELPKDLFNPTVPGTCETHGETDFMEICIEGVEGTTCVRCLNEIQLKMFKALGEAMRVAGHKVEEVKLVYREVKDVS